MSFTVGADGAITTSPLKDDEGAQWFLKHAVIATRDWIVKPATKDGRSVPTHCRLLFVYQ